MDGDSGIKVINKITCDRLGITKWEACPIWLRMANTSTVRSLGLIRQLDVILGCHTFQISVVVIHLEAPRAYPLLLGRPWLKTANIKQNWNKNLLTFRKGKNKIWVPTQNKVSTSRQCLLVHADTISMMEGLDEAEENHYFNDNPKIIPLFGVHILQALISHVEDTQGDIPIDNETMKEICLHQEATEKEMKVSQRVQDLALEEVNFAEAIINTFAIIIIKYFSY